MSRQSDESNPKIRCPLAACVTDIVSKTTCYIQQINDGRMGEEFPQCGKGWVNPVGSPGLSGIIRTTVVIYNYTEDEPGLPTVRNTELT